MTEKTGIEKNQDLAQKEAIKNELNKNLAGLFDDINLQEDTGDSDELYLNKYSEYITSKDVCGIILDKKNNKPKEKFITVNKIRKALFANYLPGEVCEILFEKNEPGNFLIVISKDSKPNKNLMSLEITSLTGSNEDSDEKAKISCNFIGRYPDDPILSVLNNKSSRIPSYRYQGKTLNQQKIDSLKLIELTRAVAAQNKLIK